MSFVTHRAGSGILYSTPQKLIHLLEQNPTSPGQITPKKSSSSLNVTPGLTLTVSLSLASVPSLVHGQNIYSPEPGKEQTKWRGNAQDSISQKKQDSFVILTPTLQAQMVSACQHRSTCEEQVRWFGFFVSPTLLGRPRHDRCQRWPICGSFRRKQCRPCLLGSLTTSQGTSFGKER